MSRFIEGEERTQSVLFPEQLEDWIAEENPVRAVDAFVDELDLAVLPLPTGSFRAPRSAMLASQVCSPQNPSVEKLAPTGNLMELASGVAHFVGSKSPWFGSIDLNMTERK